MRYRALTSDGDYQLGFGAKEFLKDSPATVAQAIKTRLAMFQGEWFLDKTVGVPYPTLVLGKNTQPVYDSVIQEAVLDTQGVESIDEYSSFLNTTTRSLVILMTVTTIYGRVQVSGAFGPAPQQFGLLDSTFILDQSVLA